MGKWLVLLAVLLAGCKEPGTADTTGALVVQDQVGRQVRLLQPGRRVVSLSPAATEILYAVGCADRLVLRDAWSDHPPEVRSVPEVRGFQPSPEAILAHRPDLVLTHFPPPALRTALEGARVPWLGLAPASLEDVQASVRLIGQACGQAAKADALARDLADRLARVRARVRGRPQPRVFYEMDAGDGTRPFTVSNKAFGHAVLEAAGGQNVFADADAPWFQVSTEAVLKADPEVILLADADSIEQPQSVAAVAARPGWSALQAVRTGKVFALQGDLVSRPGPRLVLGVEQMARALHPEAFGPARVPAQVPAPAPVAAPVPAPVPAVQETER